MDATHYVSLDLNNRGDNAPEGHALGGSFSASPLHHHNKRSESERRPYLNRADIGHGRQ